jgi:hypothetical protein
MSFVLKILHTIPPGGWTYTQENSGLKVTGGNYAELRERVRVHRDNNRYANGPQLDEEIQTQICEKMREEDRPRWCVDPAALPKPSVPFRSVSVHDVRNFLRVLGGWVKGGFQFVDQGEANRRAELCANCPKNVPITGCAGCSHIAPLLTQTIGQRRTPFDDRLEGCEACGCSNRAQCWIPYSVLKEGITSSMVWPADYACWKDPARQ